MARIAGLRPPAFRPGQGAPVDRPAPGPRPRQGRPAPLRREHALHQHHPARPAAALSRQRRTRAPDPQHHPVERHGHGGPRQHGRQVLRRPHRHLRLGLQPLRGGIQPLLPRTGRRVRRRPDILPAAFLAGHLRPGLYRGAVQRTAPGQFPPRAAPGRGALFIPPSLAHARLLDLPHGLHGLECHHVHLPGPVQPVPGRPRSQAGQRLQSLGVSRRRGNG